MSLLTTDEMMGPDVSHGPLTRKTGCEPSLDQHERNLRLRVPKLPIDETL